jgi:hypothetical protein
MSWPVTKMAFPGLGTRDTEVGVGLPKLRRRKERTRVRGLAFNISLATKLPNLVNSLAAVGP